MPVATPFLTPLYQPLTSTVAPTLLVVEPNLSEALTFKARYEAVGFKVILTCSGTEMLGCIKQIQPDILVLNSQLPGQSGAKVCSQVKAETTLEAIPLVMFNADADLAGMIAAYDAGADYYIVADVEYGQQALAHTITQVLGQRSASSTPILW
jgi:DNA-binding response OmpR family regulator